MTNNFGRKFRKKSTSGITAERKAYLEQQIKLIEKYISDNKGEVNQAMYDSLSKYKKQLTPSGKHNASKCYEDGIEFDSNLERMFYRVLKENGYQLDKDFTYQKHFEIQPAFRIQEGKILAINMYIDFVVCGRVLVDTKGLATEDWKIKWKMLKYQHRDNYIYFTPHNREECEKVIRIIKLECPPGSNG